MLFRQFPNRLCLAMALPFRGIHLVLSPLVRIVEWFSSRLLQWTGGKIFSGHLFANRSELRLFMQESAQNLTSEERAMINRVLDLQNITVRSVAVAWNRAISVSTQTPASEVLKLFAENQFSRVPVCSSDAGPRRVLGVVSLDSLIYEPEIPSGKTAGDYMKPALFLNEDLRLEEALRQMQRSGQRLAIVLGLDRKELGIVALSDVLKTIFGEVGHL
jgi:putative hemolysin